MDYFNRNAFYMIYFKILLVAICMGGVVQAQEGVDHHRYHVLDSAGFYLYSLRKLVQGEKIARVETVYYFSVDDRSPVKELTLANLAAAFPGNACFQYHLEALFHSDKGLIAYDPYLKMYKIKWLYRHCRNGTDKE